MKKIVLVDGNNLLFRSYYATSYNGVIMKNSEGFPTNALYGFINMMHKIIVEENPSYILVAFDKGKTFRHRKYKEYKAGRKEMPEELIVQFSKAKEVLDAMGIKYFEIDNYEADDIIGTVSRIVDEEDEFIATIISSDKDLLQLISDEVDVKLLKTKGFIRFNEEVFEQEYGVKPINMIDIKALMGDASDNIPGVKGIGEKTAISLLSKYKTLDNLYEHIVNVTPKTRERLLNDKDNAYMSYDLATIYREVPIPFTLEDCKYNGIDKEKFIAILKELEFKSILKKVDTNEEDQEVSEVKKIDQELHIIPIEKFNFDKPFAFYIEMDGYHYWKSNIIGIAFTNEEGSCFLNPEQLESYKNVFQNDASKYSYDIKKSIILLNKQHIAIKNCDYDAMIGAYLLDYKLSDDITLLMKQLDYDILGYEDTYGTEKRPKKVDIETTKEQTLWKSNFIFHTKEKLLQEIAENKEEKLFHDIEMPLAFILADMEMTGIKVDQDYLLNLKEEVSQKLKDMETSIYEDAGCTFNILSPKQLSNVLFVDMGIPYPKKLTKKDTGYSTNKDILDRIRDVHPIIDKILEYRNLSKLYANYVVGLLDEVSEDGKIHTVFNQCLTRTGRLSSSKPNLQNIPIRSDYSRLVRKAFIPDNNSVLMSSDYSQIELRVFAHLSKAENLQKAFIEDQDIHTQTASEIFGVDKSEVTKNMRRTAKAVNFGILYGISSFGLSEDLKIDVGSAKRFMSHYLKTYPGISEYMEKEKKEAYQKGYVTTIMNRKRVIDELKSKNFMVRSSGERMALNTPIQGSAADILKKAMVDLYNAMNEKKLKSKMLIQVHDELVFNVVNDEIDIMKDLVREKMEHVVQLSVPLKVDIEMGNNWYEAK